MRFCERESTFALLRFDSWLDENCLISADLTDCVVGQALKNVHDVLICPKILCHFFPIKLEGCRFCGPLSVHKLFTSCIR